MFEGNAYKLNVYYTGKSLKIEGKEISNWMIGWLSQSMWTDDILRWFKESFEKEQSFSREEFCDVLEQWGLGEIWGNVYLWPRGEAGRFLTDSDWTETDQ